MIVETLEERLLLSADGLFGNAYYATSAVADLNLALESEAASAFEAFEPLSQTFLLHSNPGASHTIYLDFNGHTTSGTYWNSGFNGGADFVTPAFDIDGNAANFSNTELTRIQDIWQRVAEDFMPFDVNVTTQDPGTNALIKSGGGDTTWGVRVVIGGSSYDWYGAGAGGVAYLNSFNWSNDTPTFVFEDQLGNGYAKYTAEAVSHEVGHTLGLSHDGRTSPSESYYAGHGSGVTGWAPIMGVGYYENLTQWSKGEYLNANNTQDDLAIITGSNGFGYRTDDNGNNNGSASTLSVVTTTVNDSGIIERNTDVDVFTFSIQAGTINLTINPADLGPNLDILAELYDSSGNLIASSNSSSLLSASINLSVSSGQYYLHISGTGNGDPLGTGYTDYGSLGQYQISGTVPLEASGSEDDTVSLFNPSTSSFFLRNDNSAGPADAMFGYGPAGAGWTPIAGDWDGNGTVTVGLFNPSSSTFFLKNTNTSGSADLTFRFGPSGSGWIPLVGDWDGDGTDSIGLFDPSSSKFFLRNSNSAGAADVMFRYGPSGSGWTPMAGDWDGDGTDTIGLYNPVSGKFYLRDSNSAGVADLSFRYGPAGAGWVAMTANWDASGGDSVGLYNPVNGNFYLRNNNSSGAADSTFRYGPAGAGWTPMAGDWDGVSAAPSTTQLVTSAESSTSETVQTGLAALKPSSSKTSPKPLATELPSASGALTTLATSLQADDSSRATREQQSQPSGETGATLEGTVTAKHESDSFAEEIDLALSELLDERLSTTLDDLLG